MKISIFLMIFLLLMVKIQTPCWAEINKEDLFLVGVRFVDRCQTRDIKNHSNLQEENPILGKHPSDEKIDLYFSLLIGFDLLIDNLTEEKYPTLNAIYKLFAFSSLKGVWGNYRLGLKISF